MNNTTNNSSLANEKSKAKQQRLALVAGLLIVLSISPFICYNKEQRIVIYNYLMNKIKRHDSK